MIFESHAHYQDKQFNEDRTEVLQKAFDNNVGIIVDITSYENEFEDVLELAKNNEKIYCTLGVHPHEVKNMTEDTLKKIEEYSKFSKVVAIGEIGLDYFYDYSPREDQKKWFIEQINLAKKLDLPIVVHSRDACMDTLNILKEYGHGRGVVHCFSGSLETAKEYIKLGYKIGVGGVLTFKNTKLPEIVKIIGIENIVIETDAPYLTPVPYRGQRNESSYLTIVVDKLSEIFDLSKDEIEKVTFDNALNMYEIKLK
ncbi:MAG: TatD family hydrolase [Lachnospirales bacterium]